MLKRDYLHLRMCQKAVVTNKNRAFTLKLLDKLNLTSHFTCIVCGDDTDKKALTSTINAGSRTLRDTDR